MHASMRTLASLAASAAAVLVLTPLAGAGTPAVYSDPAGDAKSAPDVSNVAIDLDTTSGLLRFDIDLAAAEQLAEGGGVFIAIDADRNSGTGDRTGSDYLVGVFADGAGMLKWNGSDMVAFNHLPMLVARASGKVTVGFCSCDIGTQTFDFAVVGFRGNDVDVAPDTGGTFPIQENAVTIQSLLYTPSPILGPKAGKRFTLKGIGVRLEGSNEIVVPDSLSCSATLAGKAVKGTGAGGCSWLLPKKARGKKLKVTVTVSYQGQTETFSQTYNVR